MGSRANGLFLFMIGGTKGMKMGGKIEIEVPGGMIGGGPFQLLISWAISLSRFRVKLSFPPLPSLRF